MPCIGAEDPESIAAQQRSPNVPATNSSAYDLDFDTWLASQTFPLPSTQPAQTEPQAALEALLFPNQNTTSGAHSSEPDYLPAIQSLRSRLEVLEQRITLPTDREQDLEMVLGNVWQALVRCQSRDTEPDSPLWKLVARFARSVLANPEPTLPQPVVPDILFDVFGPELYGHSDKGKDSMFADSGYGSGS